jgi:hypothetical protein
MQREAALRSMVADFGGVVVDQLGMVAYVNDGQGDLKKNTHWRIMIDFPGTDHHQKIRALTKRIHEAFGTEDAWIVRYPVEKIIE